MRAWWIIAAALALLLCGCADTEETDVDAAVPDTGSREASVSDYPECAKYLVCLKASGDTQIDYSQEVKLYGASGECFKSFTKDECIGFCTKGYNQLAAKYTKVKACGGTPDDAGMDQNTSAQQTGNACTKDSDCKGNLCLKKITEDGTEYTMKNGYCSRDCSTTTCGVGEGCFKAKSKSGKILRQVCLRLCTSSGDCRQNDDYTCTGGVCFPKKSP